MSAHLRIALLGFSAFERSTLSSYFRLATRREPSYEHTQDVGEADFIVADADHRPSVQLVLAAERLAETVFVGSAAPEGAKAWMGRPIDPLHVLRELDAMALASGRRAAPAASGRMRTVIQPRPRSAEAEVSEVTPTPPSPPAPATAASTAAPPAAPPATPAAPQPAQRASPPPAAAPPPPPTALLVDDSDIARRFLELRLSAWGLVCEQAATGDEALALLARKSYDWVFLDLELGEASEHDGLGLAQKIKREQATRVPPTQVVMVTAHQGELDRVRGTLAGCDAFLGKPLDDGELARVLERQGLKKRDPKAAL
jgi:CheY-like chemotaxis protein